MVKMQAEMVFLTNERPSERVKLPFICTDCLLAVCLFCRIKILRDAGDNSL